METKIERTEIKKYGTTNMMFSMFTENEAYHLVTSDKNICEDALDNESEKQKDSLNLLVAQCECYNKSIGKLSVSVSL